MSLIRRNDFFPSVPSLFNDLFAKDIWDWGMGNGSSTNTTIPAINVKETNDNFEVEVAAPGMKKDDFKVELDGNMLTISSEKKNEWEDKEDERYTRREFSYQSFQRSFQLPKDVVDENKIQAKYNNGVLHLLIPKKEHAKQKPPRMIEIN
ncbi:MAG TPA: Hsp20/alpha crystallin family protein [Chitinophagaceae bacterium]|jgi:HSP20 family protein